MIAIDPGLNGGIASFSNGSRGFACNMPRTPRDVFDCLKGHANGGIAYIEEVGGYAGGAGAPGAAMFNFGQQYGHCEMALLALGYEIRKVRPQKWQKALSLGTKGTSSKTEWKNKLKAKAQELFPHLKVTLATADALLILYAGKRGLI